PTLPFTSDEMQRILKACDEYPTHNSIGHDNRARMKAMTLLLRWSGLRIVDAAMLEWVRLQDDTIFLHTAKTGQPVRIPLPKEAVAALNALPRRGAYLFATGESKPQSVTSNWQRAYRRVWKLAKIKNGHPHRFRDTFAVELLLKGVDLADVAK